MKKINRRDFLVKLPWELAEPLHYPNYPYPFLLKQIRYG